MVYIAEAHAIDSTWPMLRGPLLEEPETLEERMAKPFLQLLDLRGQCRLRQVQKIRRTGQVPLMRDGPEVAKVMVIQLAHTSIK